MGKIISSKLRLDVFDRTKNRIIFYESQRIFKAKRHPELRDITQYGYVYVKIPATLADPDAIYRDLTNTQHRNYYKLERYVQDRYYRIPIYIKVVVSVRWGKPYKIITSYENQYIKEDGHSELCIYEKH